MSRRRYCGWLLEAGNGDDEVLYIYSLEQPRHASSPANCKCLDGHWMA
jgi:hypothetical protein